MRRLESIGAELKARPMKSVSTLPNIFAETLFHAVQTFVSRVGDPNSRAKLQELRQKVAAILGKQAIAESNGVYNSPRLYRFLLCNQMDVVDATCKVVSNFNARADLGMDNKRRRLFSEDLNFDTIPRAAEFRKYVPSNLFVGRAKDGRVINYQCLGGAVNVEGFQKAFSVKDSTEFLLYNIELSRILLDAIGAVDGCNISCVTFYDCSNFSLNSLLKLTSCELFALV